jgi:DNA polymerase
VLKILFLDTETRARLDISVGTDRYTRAAECRIVTYTFVTGPAKIWLPYCQPIPQDLKDALDDPEFLILAHNAAFDRLILARALKLVTPISRWRCTMAAASAHGLPGSLEALGRVCMLTEDEGKLTEDKGLIHTFCVPQPATGEFIEPEDKPEEWARFCAYAIRDTEALRAIFNRMPAVNYAGVNLRSWMLDQLVNERGFGFDRALATAASDFLDRAREASRKVMRENTENQIGSATQAKRLLAYIRNRYDIDIESLRAGDVRDYLESDDLDPILRTVLEERLEAGKSAGTKFKRGLVLAGPEDRIRHWCRWSGAGRTGRHAARGYQPHNMARPSITVRRPPGHKRAGRIELDPVKASTIDDVIIPGIYSGEALNNPLVYGGPFEAVAIAVRHGIIAAQGNELVVADFKNIESVITPWVAGEQSVLDAFRDLFDNPKDKSRTRTASSPARCSVKPPEEVNESERQMGKVCILAFGFGGGVAALVNMAIAYQMDLEPLAASCSRRQRPSSWRRRTRRGSARSSRVRTSSCRARSTWPATS